MSRPPKKIPIRLYVSKRTFETLTRGAKFFAEEGHHGTPGAFGAWLLAWVTQGYENAVERDGLASGSFMCAVRRLGSEQPLPERALRDLAFETVDHLQALELTLGKIRSEISLAAEAEVTSRRTGGPKLVQFQPNNPETEPVSRGTQ